MMIRGKVQAIETIAQKKEIGNDTSCSEYKGINKLPITTLHNQQYMILVIACSFLKRTKKVGQTARL